MNPDPKPKLTEADLAREMVSIFEEYGWEVFQEVETRTQGSRADLVVRRGRIIGVIECKLALGLPVLEQVWEWRQYAHYIWVATKHTGSRGRLVHKLLDDYGIGWFSKYDNDSDVREKAKATLLRKPPLLDELAKCLTEERKAFGIAGTKAGGHWTPFRWTCYGLAGIVKEQPGITLKEALGKFKHHYANTASAMSHLPEWIEKGKVEGVRIDRSDGQTRLVIIEDKEHQ